MTSCENQELVIDETEKNWLKDIWKVFYSHIPQPIPSGSQGNQGQIFVKEGD